MIRGGVKRFRAVDNRRVKYNPSIFDSSILPATRTQVLKLCVEYIFFVCPDEWLRRSVAYKLYHSCRAFRQWPVIHRLLCHTIGDRLSERMRECKDYHPHTFPGVRLNGHHWWWTHRLSIFNEVLELCFDETLYHPGSWRQNDLTHVIGSPFHFVNCNNVRLKHTYDQGVENITFWEAPDGPSTILFSYVFMKTNLEDFLVVCNVMDERVIFRSSRKGFQSWYRQSQCCDILEIFEALMWDNPAALEVMKESWNQPTLELVEKFERFVDRWFTRTPSLRIEPLE